MLMVQVSSKQGCENLSLVFEENSMVEITVSLDLLPVAILIGAAESLVQF